MDQKEVDKRKADFEEAFRKMESAIEPLRLKWRFYDVLANIFKDTNFWKKYGLDTYIEE